MVVVVVVSAEEEAMASGADEEEEEEDKRGAPRSSDFLPARPGARFLAPAIDCVDVVIGVEVLSRLGIAEEVEDVRGAMLAIRELEVTLDTDPDLVMRVVRDVLALSSRVLVKARGRGIVGGGDMTTELVVVVVVVVVVGTETIDMDVFLLPALPRLAGVVADDEMDMIVGEVVLLTGGRDVGVVDMSLGRVRGEVIVEGDSAEGAYGV